MKNYNFYIHQFNLNYFNSCNQIFYQKYITMKIKWKLYIFVLCITSREEACNGKERGEEINDFARAIVIATARSLFFAAWKSRFSYCHCRFAPFDYFDPRPSASVEHAYVQCIQIRVHHALIYEPVPSLPQQSVLSTRPWVNSLSARISLQQNFELDEEVAKTRKLKNFLDAKETWRKGLKRMSDNIFPEKRRQQLIAYIC